LQFGDNDPDVVVIGAGIVGLAAARALLARRPGLRLVVIDKEPGVAHHQSGHNSGVLHSGLYYRPGSLKAQLCTSGRTALEDYCADHGISLERCGKVVVATETSELARLSDLRDRGRANGLEVTLLDRRGLAEHEPHADGIAALFVPATGVVDFSAVCRRLADDIVLAGGDIRLCEAVSALRETEGAVVVETAGGSLRSGLVVNCSGLQTDRVARLAGARPSTRIVPFRGEYAELVPQRRHLVRHLIYPVPDPRFPFLGVHFTRGIDGEVHAGPNAVLATAREGYRWGRVDRHDVSALARDQALWRLARRYWRTGLGEVSRSISRTLMVRALQRLVPDVRATDLVPAGAGVRAQAVSDDGTLLDDFAIERSRRMVHVLNAPSPAATSSLAIGTWIADLVDGTPTTHQEAADLHRPVAGGR
jgi:(S)-2-hydroxyglutarate dehydrogenase